MAWILLIGAGIFEIGFTTCLKLCEGFTKLWPSVGFGICAILSFGMLTLAIKEIPLGTAYAIWTGIGAFGTALVGIIFFRDPVNTMRMVFLILLIGSIVGLKLVSVHQS